MIVLQWDCLICIILLWIFEFHDFEVKVVLSYQAGKAGTWDVTVESEKRAGACTLWPRGHGPLVQLVRHSITLV